MKINPYAILLFAAALSGLSLVPVSLRAAEMDDPVTPAVLKKYDANHDGVLDETEKAAWQADRQKQQAAREARRAEDLARYDANRDGKINPDERAAMRADDEKARAEKKAAQEARKAERAAQAEAKKLAKYDKNHNGKLDDDELAAVKTDEDKRKAAAEKRKATMDAKQQAADEEEGADHE
jgi:Ca2+-binding EF-hand superfamily protein